MITNSELNISNKSYTHRDFYQIYPEILELVTKITERWDPQSSNESDPGVVLLKLLAFIADKENYNIDKNILECFMPSCTQEESMRKLCDMMGYDMHYYKSATVPLTFMYQGTDLPTATEQLETADARVITIPKFTAVTNAEKDIYYVTTKDIKLTRKYEQKTVEAIEGEHCIVQVGVDNVLHLENLDSNRRFYLPETQIAENGIWVSYVDADDEWKQTYNLNTEYENSRVWKFGFDSRKRLPYIQFPEDIANLIKNGLKIDYIRTSGINGNVSAKTLDTFSKDTSFPLEGDPNKDKADVINQDNGEQLLVVNNTTASINGADAETIDEAYNGFKKTIGTFDTLVTCRDYANAIYNMVSSSDNTTPLVSNVQVADIRDDLNGSYKIMTFNDFGLCFKDVAAVSFDESGIDSNMTHFDLVIYPFNMITGSYSAESYQKSFKPGFDNWYEIQNNLEDNKTIAHNIISPNTKANTGDLFCIKAYYKLQASINTTYKVNTYEEKQILNNIYTALYKKFNARKVDFGEALVYEDILKTIETADTRIKNVISLNDFDIDMKVMYASGAESNFDGDAYELAILKNILAGRLGLLDYNKNFDFSYGQEIVPNLQPYYGSNGIDQDLPEGDTESAESEKAITLIDTELDIPANTENYILEANENIILAAPNLASSIIYPVGVNYYWDGDRVEKDQEYLLKNTDSLYILYTNSDGVLLHIQYTANEIITNGVSKPVTRNIIKPNFTLLNSQTKANDYKASHNGINYGWAKTLNADDMWTATLPGMNTLTAQDEIAIRDYVIDHLTTVTPIYWLTKSGDLENNHILETGEYFFYSDENKTVLYTFGSGTKITFNDDETAELKLDKSLIKQSLNLDDVANNGIAAFADTPWYTFKPSTAAGQISKINVQEMQLIMLAEGDILAETEKELTNGWSEIEYDDISYILNGDSVKTELPHLPADEKWLARTRLNLCMGPKLTQSIKNRDSITKTIKLYHQKYYFETEAGNRTYKYTDKPSEPLVTLHDVDLRCNYLIQEPGNANISTQITKSDGTVINDLKIQVFKAAECTCDTTSGQTYDYSTKLYNYDNYYTKLDETVTSLELPVIVADNTFGIMMIYVKSSASTVTSTLSATSACLCEYNESDIDHSVATIPLSEGLNIIKIEASTTLIITARTGDIITFDKYQLVNYSAENHNGVNMDVLRLEEEQVSSLLSHIRAIAVSNDTKFYYNAPLDTSMLINADDMQDYNAWFDYNNILNKFVISELDVSSFSNIKLTKQSRIK